MMPAARLITNFTSAVKENDIPTHVIESAKLHFADAIGVGLAASAGTIQNRWYGSVDKGGSATCIGGNSSSPADAALLNGMLIHSLEYDDTHTSSVIHGSAVAAPSALAAAEEANCSGAEMLIGYILAYEIMIRIGLAAPGMFQKNGFQVTSIAGPIATAAITCRLHGLSHEVTENAIGIAGSQASGLLAFLENGSSVKALNPGWAAHIGIKAVQLSKSGMTGPPGILENPLGVMKSFARTSGNLLDQLGDLGQVWHSQNAAFKLYPCCHYIHPFLEAIEQLMQDGLTARDVDKIDLKVANAQAPLICQPWDRKQNPLSGYDAKWALPYCIALLLITGKIDVHSFEEKPSKPVIELAKKIEWTPMKNSGFPNVFPAYVRVKRKDASVADITIRDVMGTASRPVEANLIRQKFLENAARKLDESTRNDLWSSLLEITQFKSIKNISSMLKC